MDLISAAGGVTVTAGKAVTRAIADSEAPKGSHGYG
jgi:hypothetical protein